jgi:kumamolisin
MANAKKISIRGSEHAALPGARPVGPIDPHQLIEVSVILKHRQELPKLTGKEKRINHNDFARTYGADPANVDKIRQFAKENNLHLLERGDEVLRRTITLAGTAAAMEKAFSVELNSYEHPDGSYRGHTGAIQLPEEYAAIVTGVLGLDNRPVVHPHVRLRTANRSFGTRLGTVSYNPPEVAKLYNFPSGVTGAGQTIGILDFGGGYRPADIRNYFQSLNIAPPTVKTVSVDHMLNRPSTPQSADVEVMLDIEVAGAVAPGVTIAVYFATNSARGFHDALSTAIHDQLRQPSVISLSWGGPESSWSTQSMTNFDQVAQEAALLGITITVASGDSGSSDGVNDGQAHVDFPASSPHVLAVGGTKLIATANNTIETETVWNDGAQGGATGGGYSNVFARPDWQSADVTNTNRGVPDLAADADPDTGYNILVDGQAEVVGGTSADAPLIAGLIVLLNQTLNKHLGYLNPALYAADRLTCFHDITVGNNGAYSAGYGWDPCTGLGSPIGTQLQQTLAAATATTQQAQQPQLQSQSQKAEHAHTGSK